MDSFSLIDGMDVKDGIFHPSVHVLDSSCAKRLSDEEEKEKLLLYDREFLNHLQHFTIQLISFTPRATHELTNLRRSRSRRPSVLWTHDFRRIMIEFENAQTSPVFLDSNDDKEELSSKVSQQCRPLDEFFLSSEVTVDKVHNNFQHIFSPYEPLRRHGRINFFWNGLDPEEDELLINARKRPLNSNKDWMCGFCGHWTTTKQELAEHMKNVHEGVARFHVCKICDRKLDTLFQLERHKGTHKYEPKLPHACVVNKKGIPVAEYVKDHYILGVRLPEPTEEVVLEAKLKFETLAQKKFSCLDCSKEFADAEDARNHYEDIHATIVCKRCPDSNRAFDVFSDLKKHLIQNHKMEFLVYYDQGYAKVWKYIKDEDTFYSSGAAAKLSDSFHSYAKPPEKMPWNLLKELQVESRHNSETNGHLKKVNTCKSSTKQFQPVMFKPGPTYLKNFCKACRKFIRSTDYEQHVASNCQLFKERPKKPKHSSTAKYSCEHNGCNKQFIYYKNLERHDAMYHSIDRPFRCKFCDKSYNHKSLLSRHLNRHKGVKPYICDVCSMRFHELFLLNYHRRRVHIEERPYKCIICEKGYALAWDLKKHIMAAHVTPPTPSDDKTPTTRKHKTIPKVVDVKQIIEASRLAESVFSASTKRKNSVANVADMEISAEKTNGDVDMEEVEVIFDSRS